MTAATFTLSRRRVRASRRAPASFDEMHARTPELTGPERLEAFTALRARAQARMWRDLARRVEAERR